MVSSEVLVATIMKMAVVIFTITLIMEAVSSFLTLVNTYQTTRCYIQENSHLHCAINLNQTNLNIK